MCSKSLKVRSHQTMDHILGYRKLNQYFLCDRLWFLRFNFFFLRYKKNFHPAPMKTSLFLLIFTKAANEVMKRLAKAVSAT
jgi:hypothetical protein